MQTLLPLLVITSKQNRCVCVSLSLCVAASEEIDIHYALADTMSLNDWVNFLVNDDNDSDFKPIGDLNLYSEHMSEERITGSKIDLNLSAGSTYTQVYTVVYKINQTKK